ncbi:MAG: glycosyltransferase family 2 protein [Candidatus Baltobacteraceae bacterium]
MARAQGRRMNVSVVIPVYNGADTLAECLRSLAYQTLARDQYEIIVVDDGSTDNSAEIAKACGVQVIRQRNAGAPAARNTGIAHAAGAWIAFTDSDCVCSRGWLASLVRAAEREPGALGAAGKTTGFQSATPAARFVDLMGGLDPIRSLRHPRFPFAPTSNALYRKAYVQEAGGFDARFATYDACDLHTRMRRLHDGPFVYEPRALVMHRHRRTWRAYWRQQFFYGVGYAQFVLAHRSAMRWNVLHQTRAAGDVLVKAVYAAVPAHGDTAVLRKGGLVRAAAQQAGFIATFYSARERRRWRC